MKNTGCYLCGGQARPVFEKNGRQYVKCLSCGLLYTVTPVKKKELDEYYNKVDHKPQEALDRKVYEKLIKRMKYRVGVVERYCNPGKRLLDIGCAQGDFLRTAKESGFECSGVELAAAACEYAGKQLGIVIYNAELSEIKLQPGSFDAVTMWHVFEHFTDPLKELKEIHRVLAPGGIVCSELPNLGSPAFRAQGKNWRYINDEHIFHFDKNTVARALETAGFKPVFITQISGLDWWGKLGAVKLGMHKLATKLDLGDHLIVVARKRQ